MASRDATFDLIARDKTGPGIRSVEGNLKRAQTQVDKTRQAFGRVGNDLTRGLSKATGAVNRWASSGDTAGKRFVKGIGAGVGKLADLGGTIGGSLSKAMNSAGPYVYAAMAAVLVGAAVAAAPAVAGAIVGGAALGGVVGGLILASKDSRVAGAFESLKRDVSRQLGDAASSFGPAAIEATQIARGAFQRMLPDLRRLFSASSTFVAPLTRSLGRAAEAMLSGITKAVEQAGPIIDVVGEGLVDVGRAVGQAFASLSDNGASMALALKGAFKIVEFAIAGPAIALNALVEAFEWAASKIPGLSGKLKELKGSQGNATESSKGLAGGLRGLGTDATAAANGLADVRTKAQELADSNVSFREAQIAAKNATAEASAAIKENGKAIGINTQKGRENETALNAMATAFNNEATAGEKSGISAGEASDAYHTNRAALVAMAEKAGYSREQANKLAAQLLKVPKNVNTDINADTSTAMSNLKTFQKAVNGLKGKTVTVRVTSSGDHYIPGVGTQVKDFASTGSWSESDGVGIHRTGGATKTELSMTNNVYLDGKVIDSRISRHIGDSERRQAFRTQVGRR